MNANPSIESAEVARLAADHASPERPWSQWGTYLSERQWGTVREDYSNNGDTWAYFSHDDARSRAYRWGEDGLLGWTDRRCRLCFSVALWNGQDAILKERFFGLSGPQGNHGEDVKELYYYLDGTPTHSYAKALYKYPQSAFPYERLAEENRRRSRAEREFELLDSGGFDEDRYFDVVIEYAKAAPDDTLIRVTLANRGPSPAALHLLPQVWFRNTWSWGAIEEEVASRPLISADGGALLAVHEELGSYRLECSLLPAGSEFLFTENETNAERLFHSKSASAYVKDAFHRRVVDRELEAVNPAMTGTKAAAHCRFEIEPAASVTVNLRLRASSSCGAPPATGFDSIFQQRIDEADAFYANRIDPGVSGASRNVARQAYAGLVWSEQFYSLVQSEWLAGDSGQPPPGDGHSARNADWVHLYDRDVLSMPDKWEYPYFCTWDLAFHAVSLCRIDPGFAKGQLMRLLREWYLHPNGQIPAYEWNFSDVNPPVHAWAAWRVYRLPWRASERDRDFLERVFQKLLLNFTWWVNRKDPDDKNLFGGGFLGLDNIGVFDRSKPLPMGGTLKQADGTAWMAFYCVQMFQIALELAQRDGVYEDMAMKFFEHFVRIVHAMNDLGGRGLWDEQDGFYYDMLEIDGRHEPLRVRSIVGLMPMIACGIAPWDYIVRLPDFIDRVRWFVRHRPLLSHHLVEINSQRQSDRLLSIVSQQRLDRLLKLVFDEEEFLSPYGIRAVSKHHEKNPYVYWAGGQAYSVDYEPAEGTTGMFGGNSNWRGPIWFPVNFLLIDSLRVYDRFFGSQFKVEFPTRSGNYVTLGEAAHNLTRRLISLFLPDENGRRPCHGGEGRYAENEHWSDLVQFYEYFDAETGRGCGASHQTGWTALVADLINLDAGWDA